MNTSPRPRSTSGRALLILTAVLALLALALPSPAAAAPGASGKGSITVTVVGLDAATAAKVQVSGPNGYRKTVTATTTLGRLIPGTYRVVAKPVSTATGPAIASVTPARVVLRKAKKASVTVTYVVNLLVNPGFETGAAVAAVPEYKAFATDGWTGVGYDGSGKVLPAEKGPYASTYAGGVNGGLTPTTPGPVDRGARYAVGGINNTTSTLTQVVPLAAQATVIDSGKATFVLSGWLGGFGSQTDAFALTVTFLDSGGATVGTASVGPVTAADRGNLTKLMNVAVSGAVPAGTRSASVQLATVKRTGGSFNDAYADNLLFAVS